MCTENVNDQHIQSMHDSCLDTSGEEEEEETEEEEQSNSRQYFLREHKPRTKIYEAPIGKTLSNYNLLSCYCY